jgi:adenylosuccinate lyase
MNTIQKEKTMEIHELLAVSPIDGRYREKVKDLSAFFSEYALIKYRIYVEIEYFIELCNCGIAELSHFNKKDFNTLRKLYKDFTPDNALEIKKLESISRHDIKAVEYYLKERIEGYPYEKYAEFLHFGLTSQDINNNALALSLKDFMYQNYLPLIYGILTIMKKKALEWKEVPMLARTHGQAASPTKTGKEIMVFIERIENQLHALTHLPFYGKFGGATGNFNAHYVCYPDMDWMHFADQFLGRLGLQRQQFTTQIEHYDGMAAIFDTLKRINTILLDFCRDIWIYISMDYFRQTIKEGEVGSSAMPHKVNPIDFENAEGNLGIANALYEHLSGKLPVSRLQRDLSDSTVSRNIGVATAHSIIALKSIEKGLGKLLINKDKIGQDLEDNWVVIAEAIQNVLRSAGYPKPYEALKELTRKNRKTGKKELKEFINDLDIATELKEKLLLLSPSDYTGINPEFP